MPIKPMLDQSIILFAVRHALKGGVFRVGKTTDYLEAHWDKLDEETKELIVRDIENQYETAPETTHAAWQQILDLRAP